MGRSRRENRRYTTHVSQNDAWEKRIAALWAGIGGYDEQAFVAAMDALTAELPQGSARGLFERASAQDSTGHADRAVPLYEAALAAGLPAGLRRQAVIQMSSSLRNMGHAQRAVDLLSAELEREPDALTGAVRTFLALALVDVGREREAVASALTALAEYLPRYNRSVARYAAALTETAPG